MITINILKKIAVAVSAVMIVLCLASCGTGESIDLSDYLVISVSGPDGSGVASYSLDRDAFLEDYAGKISLTNKGGDNILLSSMSALGEDPADMLISSIGGSFDRSTGLSNGDTITFTWKINSDVEKNYGVELVTDPVTYIVSGLESDDETTAPDEPEETKPAEEAETPEKETEAPAEKAEEEEEPEVSEAEAENTETQEIEENPEVSETTDTAEQAEEIVLLPSEDVVYSIADQFDLWAGNMYGIEGSLIQMNTDLAAELAATVLFSNDQDSLGKDYYDFDSSVQYYLISEDLLQNCIRDLFGSGFQLSDFSNTEPVSVFTSVASGYHFFRNCLYKTGNGQYRYNFIGTGDFNDVVPVVDSIDVCDDGYAECIASVRYELCYMGSADTGTSSADTSAGSRTVEFGLNPDPSTDTGWAIATIRVL